MAQAQALLASMPTDALPPHAPLPLGSNMILARNPLFVGRGEDLLRMAAALKSGGTLALGQVIAATGLGGLGKTQLAVEFVHRYGRYFAGGVFWLSFASPDEIPLQVVSCGGPGSMGLTSGAEGLSFGERLELVLGAWKGELPRLLIFDNCEDETLLQAWRPASGGSRVLATSRRAHWSATLGVTALTLDRLPRAESVLLLHCYRPDLPAVDSDLDAIAREVGDLPLALHLAGSFLRTYQAEVSPSAYIDQLRRSEVLDHASFLGHGLDDSPSPTGHLQNLAQTFALSFSRLDIARETDRMAVLLLARMACLAPGEPLPRELLMETVSETRPLLRADGLRRLGNLGLIESSNEWLRLHRLLVQFVRREGVDPGARPAVEEMLIGCGHRAATHDLVGPPLLALIPHLIHVAGSSADESEGGKSSALRNATGLALQSAGDLAAARPLFEYALNVYERVLGPEHADTAATLNNLARLLSDQGELAAARPLLERALTITETIYGREHADVAAVLDNLAWLVQSQGDLAAAKPLEERALAIREKVLGPEHKDTAESLNDLAVLLQDLGELAAARPLHERALAVREKMLGPEHAKTAESLNNLAWLLRDQGEFAAARPLFERALAIRVSQLGPEHPDTAQGLNNLALLLKAQGELAGARPLYERALAIREKVLGAEHPDTAQSRNNLAMLLKAQGDLVASRPLQEHALATWERTLGPDHPETALALHNLAELLRADGDLAKARPLHERALAIRERILGAMHPRTAASLHNLAELLRSQGDFAAAKSHYERALAIRDAVLGPDHPDSVASRQAVESLPLESNE